MALSSDQNDDYDVYDNPPSDYVNPPSDYVNPPSDYVNKKKPNNEHELYRALFAANAARDSKTKSNHEEENESKLNSCLNLIFIIR